MSEKMKCGKVNVRLRLFTFATLRIAIFLYKLSMTSSKRIEESCIFLFFLVFLKPAKR